MTARPVRTPAVLQMEAVECGAAALGIILAHYGKWLPLEELRVACGVGRDGSNAKSILLAARACGPEAKAMRYSPGSLRTKVSAPAILFWDFNHFLVLEGFRVETVHLNDPATGRRTAGVEEFGRRYTGVVLTFARTPTFTPSGRPPSIVAALWSRLSRCPAFLAAFVALALLSALPTLVAATIVRVFVDEVLIAGAVGSMPSLVLAAPAALGLQVAVTLALQVLLQRLEISLSLTARRRSCGTSFDCRTQSSCSGCRATSCSASARTTAPRRPSRPTSPSPLRSSSARWSSLR